MAITEEDRNHLYNGVREKLSARDAATMMELLPPVGWADVATKRDLDHLERRFDEIDRRFEELPRIFVTKDDLRQVEAEIRSTSWRLIGVIGAATTVLGIIVSMQ